MADVSKTVFISYRRSGGSAWAQLVRQNLHANGYDVFLDVRDIPSGPFDETILKEIAARDHFVLILNPGALERCKEPDDWLRREIEEALRLKRNVVPVLVDGFDFRNARDCLTGKLEELDRQNGLELRHESLDATLDRLRDVALRKVVPPPPNSPIQPAKSDELLIVVARFRGPEEIDPQDYITGRLEEELPKHPTLEGRVRVACFPKVMEGENRAAELARARELAEELRAALVIWGVHDRYHLRAHYVVGRGVEVRTLVDLEEHRALPSQLDEFVLYVQVGLPQTMTYLALFTIGQMHHFADKDGEAEGLFSAALECLPEGDRYEQSEVALRLYRGVAYLKKDEYKQAIADLTEAIRLRPDHAEAHNNRGVAYHNKGEHEQAIADYTEAIRLKPNYASAYHNRGLAYDDLDKYDQAIDDYDRAIQLNPRDSSLYGLRGSAYAGKDQHERAIADFETAICMDPEHPCFYGRRGLSYSAKGEFERANADCMEFIRLQPNFAGAYNIRGLVYVEQGDYECAIADYTEAIHLKPDFVAAYLNRGNAYSYQGDHEQAIADYTEAIRLRPDHAEAYNNRGVAYHNKGEHEQAIADYTEAIRLKPDYGCAYCQRAMVHHKDGECEQAIANFTEAIRLNPNCAEAYIERASTYYDLSQFEQAIADCTEAMRLKPDLAEAYYNRASTYADIGKHEQAITDYTEAIRLRPDYAEAYNNLSDALSKLGQSKAGAEREGLLRRALEAAMRAEELGEGKGAYNVACFHCLLGEKAEALVWLESALERDTELTREDILQDTDFAEIRESEEFRQLLEKYRPA